MDLRTVGAALRDRVTAGTPERLGIDTRSLAAFRVALGLLLVADLLLRSRDLVAHYTDRGVLPVAALETTYPAFARYSLHALSGSARWQVFLFVVAGVAAVALTLGYRTRFATFASWILLVSLQQRNPVVLNGGDVLFRMLLFWALFLPLGARWSLDARRGADRPRRVVGVASAALLVQVLIMYGSNAVMKLSGDLWLSGRAIEYVFSLDQFTVLLGDVIAQYPLLLHVADAVWLTMLCLCPLLVVLRGWRRAAFAGLFMFLHVGMLLTMQLGLFPLIAVSALVPFLPGVVWDDGVTRLPTGGLRRAVDRWGARLDRWLPAGPRVDLPAARRGVRHAVPAVVTGFLVLVVVINVSATGFVAVPDQADPVADATFVWQRWNMFAPEPVQVDGWYVVPGELENGSQVDALYGGPVSWERPPDLADTYPNARWRKYQVNLWRRGYSEHRKYFAAYLCQRWNANHDVDLESVTLYYMEQPTRLDGPEPIEKVQLWFRQCRTDRPLAE